MSGRKHFINNLSNKPNQIGWEDDKSGQRRKIFWDEENRIRAIMDNGATYHYVYDAAGERVLKGHSSGQAIYLNSDSKGGSSSMGNFTVYVNPSSRASVTRAKDC